MERITVKAPAKINLFLHVNGRREDGYHLLDSLAVFADDIADILTFTPQDGFSFDVSGRFSAGLNTDNLVMKAVRLMEDACGKYLRGHLRLEKNIPVGAGLGGGSSDAAALVKMVEGIWRKPLDQKARNEILLKLGADVPVCYARRACRFQGIGDVITDAPSLPGLHMLMVWPDVHTVTKDVFITHRQTHREAPVDMPASFGAFSSFITFLETTGNDLADAAEKLHPVIATARDAIRQTDGCLLSRMSGSGSCVFGMFETENLCTAAKNRITTQYPQWWVHTAYISGN